MSTLYSHFFEKINQISPLEYNFTEGLASIALKPRILYFYGKMPKNVAKSTKKADSGQRPKVVAIVGARHNTEYGKEVAYKLAYELAQHGVIVISGLAYGIDAIAHRGCLDGGGVTVSVLGTPIDRIYPKENIGLAAKIIEQNGAIISEYAPATREGWSKIQPRMREKSSKNAEIHGKLGENDNILVQKGEILPENAPLAPGEYISRAGQRRVMPKPAFLYRNRLISGLADAVVVVEAARRSGSLNTAAHALAQGKDVFAVPGNITNPYSQGCNKLIAEGAFPYSEPDDVLRELFPAEFNQKCQKMRKNNLIGDTDAETSVLKALSQGARKGDEIMKIALLPPEVFSQTITLLEIKSRVRALGANNWCLA